jgi:predicted outer membrane protein
VGKLSVADQKFVDSAAVGGLYEVEAGKLAEKSANPQVKQFGARMVHDHGAAGAKLKQIVTAQGGTAPQELDQEHQQKLDHLRSLRGSEFAQAYMQDMVKDHDTDAQEFGQAAQSLDKKPGQSAAEDIRTTDVEGDRGARQDGASDHRQDGDQVVLGFGPAFSPVQAMMASGSMRGTRSSPRPSDDCRLRGVNRQVHLPMPRFTRSLRHDRWKQQADRYARASALATPTFIPPMELADHRC